MISPRIVAALGVASTLALTSCGTQSSNPITVQTLDRPTDLAFACYGRLRLVNTPEMTTPYTPQPLGSCRTRSGPALTMTQADDPDNAPPGQEDRGSEVLGPGFLWYGFALQPVSGTVAMLRAPVKPAGQTYDQTGEIFVLDGDALAPGMNSLSVGPEPIAIATAPSGCHLLTANAGSCDLSVIDAKRAIEHPEGLPLVRKQGITNADGSPLRARPAAMVTDAREDAIGDACPAQPDGLAYIAYPDCHAVAVIDNATGAAVASIRFAADGTATLGDGNLACPAQCGTVQPVTDGARPVTLDMMSDTKNGLRRLGIGLDNRPVVTVVELDADWKPASVKQIELEGDVGVTEISLTKRLGMTGATGFNDNTTVGAVVPAEFAYAVTTDGTVRVVEVGTQNTECDTQVDPRYLRGINDPAVFVCMPVGAIGTPPRRALATGPGIQLPNQDIALHVTVTSAGVNSTTAIGEPDPLQTIGHFAFVAGSSGTVYTVNIDDDAYVDTYIETAPFSSILPLALPHQLRDALSHRNATDVTAAGVLTNETDPPCISAVTGINNGPPGTSGPPRLLQAPQAVLATDQIASAKGFMLPYVRQVDCVRDPGTSKVTEAAVSELSWTAPLAVRADLFPDLLALPYQETWSITWEGSLSRDSVSSAVDGPAVRAGQLEVGGGAMTIHDAGRPFCAAGVEPYDQVVLRGCDPSLGAGQCGIGQTCYVHADSTVGTGACLPTARADELGALCRDYLISVRHYAIQEADADKLVLSERRRVLRTTPIDGCTSAAQCTRLAAYEASLTSSAHPKNQGSTSTSRTWACEADPTRDASINRCMMTCQTSNDCDAGTMCSGGYCIEGPIPSPQCIAGLQRYELRGTDAFVAVGTKTGFLHPVIEDPGTGRCMHDPQANPLLVGRIPLKVPPCSGTSVTDLSPNPCRTTIDHTNTFPNYTDLVSCSLGTPQLQIRTSQVDAIRFSNPALTFHLVDTTYQGDKRCLHDRMGNRTGIPVVFPGYSISLSPVGGFLAQAAGSAVVLPSRLVRSPEGAVWVVDEGDIIPNINVAVNTQGQILRIDPNALNLDAIIQ